MNVNEPHERERKEKEQCINTVLSAFVIRLEKNRSRRQAEK
jgi:hypothetical protein